MALKQLRLLYVNLLSSHVLEKCMSDVHCPICLVMLCKPTVYQLGMRTLYIQIGNI